MSVLEELDRIKQQIEDIEREVQALKALLEAAYAAARAQSQSDP